MVPAITTSILFCIVHCRLRTEHCRSHTNHRALYIAHRPFFTHYILYIEHCKLHILRWTMPAAFKPVQSAAVPLPALPASSPRLPREVSVPLHEHSRAQCKDESFLFCFVLFHSFQIQILEPPSPLPLPLRASPRAHLLPLDSHDTQQSAPVTPAAPFSVLLSFCVVVPVKQRLGDSTIVLPSDHALHRGQMK